MTTILMRPRLGSRPPATPISQCPSAGAPSPRRRGAQYKRNAPQLEAQSGARSALRSGGTGPASTELRLLLDSADVREWRRWMRTGIFSGITTNPSILEKDGVACTLPSLRDLAKQALDYGAEEFQLQAWGESVHELGEVSTQLAAISPNHVVIKLPCTPDGLEIAKILVANGVRVTITGVYAAPQVLAAIAVGASYAAPYLGRMNDAYGAGEGFKQVVQMQSAIRQTQSSLRLLVASLREASDLSQLAAEGCDTFTMSPAVAAKMLNVPLTMQAAATFQAAARRMGAYGPAGAAAAGHAGSTSGGGGGGGKT